ncbi:FMN-binding protein [Kribbella sp. DT2]|uniref:FMN-binding protein n=1 Tax=Kribbella sp. DT2 TaxID=3393427 RepID=UPI003CF0B027
MSSHSTRRRRNALAVGATGTLLGLLFVYPTSTNRLSGPPPPAAPAGIVSAAPAQNTVTVNGVAAHTRYGDVQVKVRSHRIVAVTTIASPSSESRDREISSFALPTLEQEAITAQSAQIDTVSGATFTSDGYRQSLQSALDAAHYQPPR